MQYGERFVGKYWDTEVPKSWPLLVAIDDGYFEEPDVPMERTAIHNTTTPPQNMPADFGDYEIINNHEGQCRVVLIRMKKG